MRNKNELQQSVPSIKTPGYDAQSVVFKAVTASFTRRAPLGDLNVTRDALADHEGAEDRFSAFGQAQASDLASLASNLIRKSDRDGLGTWPISRGQTVSEQE
jgi:hypothetical protein